MKRVGRSTVNIVENLTIKGNHMKTFLCGTSGSGKTTLAKQYSIESNTLYIDFDKNWGSKYKGYVPSSMIDATEAFLGELPDDFVIDGLCFNPEGASFKDYITDNDCQIIYVFSSDAYTLLLRMFDKIKNGHYPYYIDGIINAILITMKSDIEFIDSLKVSSKLYYDSYLNKYVTKTEADQVLQNLKPFTTETLNKYLKSLSVDIWNYQDIECINYIGYAKSYLSWENLFNLVEWKDKTVVDIGCNSGYFSFKAEKEGAQVIGLDRENQYLIIANLIKEVIGSKAILREWVDGQPLPDSDILLCLNVFHHLKDKTKFLRAIKSKQVIFEIDKEDYDLVEKYFKILVCKPSHRASFHTPGQANRFVILATKEK